MELQNESCLETCDCIPSCRKLHALTGFDIELEHIPVWFRAATRNAEILLFSFIAQVLVLIFQLNLLMKSAVRRCAKEAGCCKYFIRLRV
jgi:hypothetical protein